MINKKGFTLIELLLALGILGIVSTVIFSIFITNINNFERDQKRIEVQQNMRTAVEFISREAMESKGIAEIKDLNNQKIDLKNLKVYNSNTISIKSIVFKMIEKDNHEYSRFEVNKGINSVLKYGKFANSTNNEIAYYIKKIDIQLLLQGENINGMTFTICTDEKYNIKPIETSVYFRNMGVGK